MFDPPPDLPPGWEMHFNDDGIPYFWNVATFESSWMMPTASSNQPIDSEEQPSSTIVSHGLAASLPEDSPPSEDKDSKKEKSKRRSKSASPAVASKDKEEKGESAFEKLKRRTSRFTLRLRGSKKADGGDSDPNNSADETAEDRGRTRSRSLFGTKSKDKDKERSSSPAATPTLARKSSQLSVPLGGGGEGLSSSLEIPNSPPQVVAVKPVNILSEDPSLPQSTRMRNKVINEVIGTERQYVDDLETILNVFLNPLKSANLIPKDSVGAIFSNVELLVGVNRVLCEDLEEQARKYGGDKIGSSFIKLADYLKMYSVYCSNQKVSLDTIEMWSTKKPQFKELLQQCEAHPKCKGLNLGSFLIKPIQRICKYPLLLRELIKHTEGDNRDSQNLKIAAEKIEEVVGTINERKRQDENNAKILELQNTHENGEKLNLVSPGRKYIREGIIGELKDYGSAKGTRITEAKYFLFNDLLIRSKPSRGGKLVCKLMIPIEHLLIEDFEEGPSSVLGNVFEVTHKEKNSKHTLFASNKDEKNSWLDALRQLLPKTSQDITSFTSSPSIRRRSRSESDKRASIYNLHQARLSRKSLPPPPDTRKSLPNAPSVAGGLHKIRFHFAYKFNNSLTRISITLLGPCSKTGQ
eukprot:TRINITY_DN1615_c1_g2_i1.p1 TRINITY_DN1615_c1_g2~~TRINITY_DN1615_c1_g2_i1.p1  ORF type:complete len:637 (-),score=180.86 TRINITY_DN1615_c1_g2_i1:36-1946(-)